MLKPFTALTLMATLIVPSLAIAGVVSQRDPGRRLVSQELPTRNIRFVELDSAGNITRTIGDERGYPASSLDRRILAQQATAGVEMVAYSVLAFGGFIGGFFTQMEGEMSHAAVTRTLGGALMATGVLGATLPQFLPNLSPFDQWGKSRSIIQTRDKALNKTAESLDSYEAKLTRSLRGISSSDTR
jgi:hypothetical protein